MANQNSWAEHILDTDISSSAQATAGKLLEQANYTTTALYAISLALRGLEDEKGADMIATFAKQFAEYEATII